MVGKIDRTTVVEHQTIESNGLVIKRLSSPVTNPRQTKGHRILHDTIVALRQLVAALPEIKQVDLIMSASPPILTPLIACTLARVYKRPHVFEVRDLLAEGLKAGGIIRNHAFVASIGAIEKLCFMISDGLVAVTPGIQRLMLLKGVAETKIKLVTNGVEDALYQIRPDREQIRKQWKISQNAFVVFFSGTLSSFSNVGILLEAAELLKDQPNLLFIIAGEGQKRKEYEGCCQQQELKNVRFIGARPRAEIPGLCFMADICVHMFKEGPFWDIFLSNKIFDYMGAGRPVIYSGAGDSADLIRRSKGGLVVKSEDANAFAEGILRMFQNPEEKERMGRSAKDYVLTFYSREKLLTELEKYLVHTATTKNENTELRN
jgi:glycosyltransferase involved in cell wall biosynthesis